LNKLLKHTLKFGFLLFVLFSFKLTEHKYGLNPLNDIGVYKNQITENPHLELIDLKHHIPEIELDIRYATSNNFVGKPVYKQAKAYARKPVAKALLHAQNEFKTLGYSLKIFDAYRPYSITVKFYEIYKDTTYVASPYSGSRHNRGAAIDLTLIDLKTGKDVDMGTEYDDFTVKAHPTNESLSPDILRNRDLLISVMIKNGFSVYPSEWWHFDYNGWMEFELLDLSFEQLKSGENINR